MKHPHTTATHTPHRRAARLWRRTTSASASTSTPATVESPASCGTHTWDTPWDTLQSPLGTAKVWRLPRQGPRWTDVSYPSPAARRMCERVSPITALISSSRCLHTTRPPAVRNAIEIHHRPHRISCEGARGGKIRISRLAIQCNSLCIHIHTYKFCSFEFVY